MTGIYRFGNKYSYFLVGIQLNWWERMRDVISERNLLQADRDIVVSSNATPIKQIWQQSGSNEFFCFPVHIKCYGQKWSLLPWLTSFHEQSSLQHERLFWPHFPHSRTSFKVGTQPSQSPPLLHPPGLRSLLTLSATSTAPSPGADSTSEAAFFLHP